MAAYGATGFLSACLLFTIQLIFGKTVLPLLGGSAAVWTTCMLFFQSMLLAGYGYAHLLTSRVSLRRQPLVHASLLAASLLAIPVALPAGAAPGPGASPAGWLLRVLAVSLGLPFFALSTTAPLIQHWFSRTPHPRAPDPYFLYAASNLGSLLGLLAYPALVEPAVPLSAQRHAWALGYWLFVAGTLACAILLTASRPRRSPGDASGPISGAPITVAQRLRWVVLALVPSSLLLGVTQYLTTDIAPIPLLWVIPLALYLLTFVLVFARRPPIAHEWMVRLQPFLLVLLVLLWFWRVNGTAPVFIPLHLAAFFVSAMVCHGELARRRPAAAGLTEFYLWISLGGALGGLFNVLAAPALFTDLVEYPLALVAACLLRPRIGEDRPGRRDVLAPALAIVPGVVLVLAGVSVGDLGDALAVDAKAAIAKVVLASTAAAVLAFAFRLRPLAFGISLAGILVAGSALYAARSRVLYAERNFFGVHHVTEDGRGDYHVLRHGTSVHGAQSRVPGKRGEPLTYYSREGPLGQALEALPASPARRVAVVGLGAGSVSAYASSGETWTYYEIDPVVERIARDSTLFTFLQDCAAPVQVQLGDARLSLGAAAPDQYDLLILDAFSSDVIPVHLLTQEAFELYRSRLRPGGVLLLHLSNRYLDLVPIVAANAQAARLVGRFQPAQPLAPELLREWKSPSTWAALAGSPGDLGPLTRDPRWRWLGSVRRVRGWTDDFSDVWSVFHWR